MAQADFSASGGNALDLDPTVASSMPPATNIALQAGQFSFRYQRRANAYVRWTYDSSTDLAQWTALLDLADYTETILPSAPGTELVEVILNPEPNAPRRFIRLVARPMP